MASTRLVPLGREQAQRVTVQRWLLKQRFECCPDHPAAALPRAAPLQAKPYTLWRVAVDALAAGMLVTCLLDFWRIGFGGIVEEGAHQPGGLPWLG